MKKHGLLAILALALLVLVFLTYSNHFTNPFQFDDSHTIQTNSAIRALRNIPRFFIDASTTSSLPQNADYRPGLTTLNAIDYALGGGLNPFAFHRSIFISYLILGILLYLFYLRICQMAADRPWLKLLALGAAGWFMLHAANAETINYIIQRGDSFSTLMVVLSFVIYLYAPGWRKYYIYLIPMALGFFVKLPALMFAPLLFVYDLLFERSPGLTRRVRDSRWPQLVKSFTVALPAFGAAFLLALLSKLAVAGYWSGFRTPVWQYLITQPFVFVHYFDNFLLPIQLSVDTDWKLLASPVDDRFFAGITFVLLLLGIAGYAARRAVSRPITFGILWFFIALLPTSSLIPLDEVLNDHRPFFAYIGLVLAFSWALGLVILRYEAFFARSRIAQAALASLVVMLLVSHAFGVYQRNKVWSSAEALWHDATIKSPGNGRALMNYGLTQMVKGKYDIALDYFNRAYQLTPNYSVLHVNLGILHGAMNQPAEAERYFRSALQLAPDVPSSHYYYARWLADQGRIAAARASTDKALSLSSGYTDAAELTAYLQSDGLYDSLISSSVAHYRAGDFEKSLHAAQSASEVKPESALAYNNICAAYNGLQRWDKAIGACQRALTIAKDFELAKRNLREAQAGGKLETKSYEDYINDSLALYNARDYEGSIAAAQKALAIQPNSAIAYNNICAAYNALKLWDNAIEACEHAVAIDPNLVLAKNNLSAAVLAKQKR